MIYESLIWCTSLLAGLHEYGSTHGIAQVLLAGIVLDYRTTAHNGMVGGVVFLAIIGVPSMSIVGTNHERMLYAHGKVFKVGIAASTLLGH
jgi:hypothetical protein